MNISRRNFIRHSATVLRAAGGATVLGQLGTINANATPAQSYKALVCVFLAGGNDCHNAVIPLDNRFAAYGSARAGSPIFVPQSSLLPIGNGSFGLSPNYKSLQSLYNAGKVAIVANVGPIKATSAVDPKTINSSNFTVYQPDGAFSHSDQQRQWHTAAATNLSGQTPRSSRTPRPASGPVRREQPAGRAAPG